jgi:hypothetical protein
MYKLKKYPRFMAKEKVGIILGMEGSLRILKNLGNKTPPK